MLTHSEKLLQLLFDAFEQHVFQLNEITATLSYYFFPFQTRTHHHHRQRAETDDSNLHKLLQCSPRPTRRAMYSCLLSSSTSMSSPPSFSSVTVVCPKTSWVVVKSRQSSSASSISSTWTQLRWQAHVLCAPLRIHPALCPYANASKQQSTLQYLLCISRLMYCESPRRIGTPAYGEPTKVCTAPILDAQPKR